MTDFGYIALYGSLFRHNSVGPVSCFTRIASIMVSFGLCLTRSGDDLVVGGRGFAPPTQGPWASLGSQPCGSLGVPGVLGVLGVLGGPWKRRRSSAEFGGRSQEDLRKEPGETRRNQEKLGGSQEKSSRSQEEPGAALKSQEATPARCPWGSLGGQPWGSLGVPGGPWVGGPWGSQDGP